MQVCSSTKNLALVSIIALSTCPLSGCLKRVDGVIDSIERNQTGGLTIKSRLPDGERITANVIGGDTDGRIMRDCRWGLEITFHSPSAVSIGPEGLAFDVKAPNVGCNQGNPLPK